MDERSRSWTSGGETASTGETVLRDQLRGFWLLSKLYRNGSPADRSLSLKAIRALVGRVHPVVSLRYLRLLREHERGAARTAPCPTGGHAP